MSERRGVAAPGCIVMRYVRTFWSAGEKYIEFEPISQVEEPSEAQAEAKTARKPVPRRDPLSEERD